MAHIRGIGGVFLYARDPRALADWYADTLGIEIITYEKGANYAHEFAWDGGAHGFDRNTTWAILQASEAQAEARPRTVVNYHVADLPGFLDGLRAKGITIEKTEDHDYGRFAWLTDPEGHRIELYEAVMPASMESA